MKHSKMGLLSMAVLAGSLPVPFYTNPCAARFSSELEREDRLKQAENTKQLKLTAAEAKRQRKAAKRAALQEVRA